MISIFLAAALAPSSDFSISDTTDNITGLRTVSAMQVKTDGGHINMLDLRCSEHRPSIAFEFVNASLPEWIVIVHGGGDGADTPFIFERVQDTTDEFKLYGDPNSLVKQIADDEVREFIAYTPNGERRVSFGFSGFSAAWKRVIAACH